MSGMALAQCNGTWFRFLSDSHLPRLRNDLARSLRQRRFASQPRLAQLPWEKVTPHPNYAEGVAPILGGQDKSIQNCVGVMSAAFFYLVMTEHLWRSICMCDLLSQGSCATLGCEAKRRWRKDLSRSQLTSFDAGRSSLIGEVQIVVGNIRDANDEHSHPAFRSMNNSGRNVDK